MDVIGFCGKKYSGKDEAALHLENRYGFSRMDLSKDVLNPMLGQQGKEVTRDNQVELVGKLRKERGIDVLAVIACGKINGNFCVSGIRFREEVDYFRKMFGRGFRLVSIECDDEIRFERSVKQKVKGEGKGTLADFLKRESLPTEKVIPETMKLADFTIANNGHLDDLYKQIDSIMANLAK